MNMNNDLSALHDGLDAIHCCRPPRGKHHVEAFLQASMMSDEDLMEWIRENWRGYSYKNMHGLLTQSMSSVLNSKRLKDAITTIDSLYNVEKIDESFSNIFKSKDDGNKLTSFSQRLRRGSVM